MSARRTELLVVGTLLLVAVVAWALIPTYPNYDAYYHLDWGRELFAGHLPSFEAYKAPTEHPLYLALCAVVGLLGPHGDRVLVLFTCLCHVAFTYAVYRLAGAIWDRRAGVAAALLAGSSFALLLYAARAYVDEPFLALVLWAAALEAERPRREGRSAHVPLALFGAGAFTFFATSAAGLSVLPRYLTVPAVALCLPAGWLLTRSRALLVLAVVAGLAFVVVKADAFSRLATELRFIRSTHDDLAAVLGTPQVRAARRCGAVTLPNYRLVPDTRWVLHAGPRQVGSRSARKRTSGVALLLVGDKLLRRYGFADGASPKTNAPPDGFERGPRRGGFTAYVSCPRG